MTVRQQQRRDTEAQWSAANPVLAPGEIGVQTDGDDAGRYKIGDGTTAWDALPWAAPRTENPTGGDSNYAPITDPTLEGTTTIETLDVTDSSEALRVAPTTDETALEVEVPNTQTASAVSVVQTNDPDIQILDIAPDGTTTLDGSAAVSGDVVVGDDAADHTTISGASVTVTPDTAEDDAVVLDGTKVGTAVDAAIGVKDNGNWVARVLGNGRILKTGPQGSTSDVLNRSEGDARWLRAIAGNVTAVSNLNGDRLTIPTGTWLVFWASFTAGNSVISNVGVAQRSGGNYTPDSGATGVVGYLVRANA